MTKFPLRVPFTFKSPFCYSKERVLLCADSITEYFGIKNDFVLVLSNKSFKGSKKITLRRMFRCIGGPMYSLNTEFGGEVFADATDEWIENKLGYLFDFGDSYRDFWIAFE